MRLQFSAGPCSGQHRGNAERLPKGTRPPKGGSMPTPTTSCSSLDIRSATASAVTFRISSSVTLPLCCTNSRPACTLKSAYVMARRMMRTSSSSLTRRRSSTRSPATTILALGAPRLHLMQPAGPRLLDANARPIESALGHPLEDPAHPVHRAGKVEVRLVVLHPPGLDLVNLQRRERTSPGRLILESAPPEGVRSRGENIPRCR